MTFTESRWTYWKWALTNTLFLVGFGFAPIFLHYTGKSFTGWQMGFPVILMCLGAFVYIYQRAIFQEFLHIDSQVIHIHFKSLDVDIPRSDFASCFRIPVEEADDQYAFTVKDGR